MSPIIEAAMNEYLPPLFFDGSVRLEHSILDGTETLLDTAMLITGYTD
jgi:hypothetical protein